MDKLFIGLAILFAYLWLMWWLFVFVAPTLLTIEVLIGVVPVFVAYYRAARAVFSRSGRTAAELLWPGIASLLGLIYVEVAAVLCVILQRFGLQSALLNEASTLLGELQRAIRRVLTPLFLGPWGLEALPGILEEAHFTLAAALFIAIETVPIVAMLVLARGLQSGVQDESEPAFRQYFFAEAWRDLERLLVDAPKGLLAIFRHATLIVLGINKRFEALGFLAIFLWPLILTTLASLAAPALVCVAALGLLLAAHSLTVLVIMGGAGAVSGLLFLTERSLILLRSGYAKCPHAGCYQAVPLPVYQCPDCGARHERLVPGRNGVFHRVCQCTARLPTLFLLGKARLLGYCPQCKGPMSHQLIGANVHVPVYGGPATGKTMLLMASTWQLVERAVPELRAAFIDERDTDLYRDRWKPDFESGRLREKTVDLLPDAVLLSLRRRSGLAVSLYMYDPAGEVMERQELEGHRFLGHYDGLALLIDPLSLPDMAECYRDQVGEAPPPTTSPTHPLDGLNRIVNALEGQGQLSRSAKHGKNLAVVLTKGDIPVVQRELGVSLCSDVPGGAWPASGEVQSAAIRRWFVLHEPALAQMLETRFRNVRYFLVSALGHLPERSGTFQPKNVLAPLFWLLSTRRILTAPDSMRTAVRLAEGAVVGAIVAASAGLLYLGAIGAMVLRDDLLSRGTRRTSGSAEVPDARLAAADRAVHLAGSGSFLWVRGSPSESSPQVGSLQDGARVQILEKRRGWLRIPWGGREAWVSEAYTRPIGAAEVTESSAAVKGREVAGPGEGIGTQPMPVDREEAAGVGGPGTIQQTSALGLEGALALRRAEASFRRADLYVALDECSRARDLGADPDEVAQLESRIRKAIQILER